MRGGEGAPRRLVSFVSQAICAWRGSCPPNSSRGSRPRSCSPDSSRGSMSSSRSEPSSSSPSSLGRAAGTAGALEYTCSCLFFGVLPLTAMHLRLGTPHETGSPRGIMATCTGKRAVVVLGRLLERRTLRLKWRVRKPDILYQGRHPDGAGGKDRDLPLLLFDIFRSKG